MDEHRTLEEFLGGRSTDSDADPQDGGVESDRQESEQSDADPGAESQSPADDDVEPTTGTYRWTPDGTECGACGTSVERRWRNGDAFVCPDCKEW